MATLLIWFRFGNGWATVYIFSMFITALVIDYTANGILTQLWSAVLNSGCTTDASCGCVDDCLAVVTQR